MPEVAEQAYAPTVWVDGVTPVNAANLNKLEQGLAAAVGVPADTVVAFNAFLLRNEIVGSDTQPAFRLMGDGKIEWGPGGSTAPDTNFYRSTAGLIGSSPIIFDTAVGAVLRGKQAAGSYLIRNKLAETDTDVTFGILGDGKQQWGPGGVTLTDTNLYRYNAGILKTDGSLTVNNALYVDTSGAGYPLYFGAAADVSLNRYGAGYLACSGGFFATKFAAQFSTANQVLIEADGHIYFGPTSDVNLYRYGADILATDDALRVGGALTHGSYIQNNGQALYSYVFTTGAGPPGGSDTQARFTIQNSGHVFWGDGASAPDVNLYRVGAGLLKTDNTFWAGGGVLANQGLATQIALSPDGKLYFGNATDTSLYRSAADTLKTDDIFISALGLYTFGDVTARGGTGQQVSFGNLTGNAGIQFGSPADTDLYRAGVGLLATTGLLSVAKDISLDTGNAGHRLYIGSDTSLRRVSAGVMKAEGRIETRNAIPIDITTPRVQSLGGNSFWTVRAGTSIDWGHWEWLKDVDGYIYGQVRVESAFAGASIVMAICAPATAGVTRLLIDFAIVTPTGNMNPSFSGLSPQEITVPGTTMTRKDVTFTGITACAEGDLILFGLVHHGSHANDTLAQNTMLIGAWLVPTA